MSHPANDKWFSDILEILDDHRITGEDLRRYEIRVEDYDGRPGEVVDQIIAEMMAQDREKETVQC